MVNNSDTKVSYQGNGQTTVFPFSFPFIQRDYIKVAIYDSLTDETKTIDSDYYVDTVANTVIYPGYEPGQEPAEALRPPILPATSTITIYRQTDVDQLTDLGEKYPLKDIENMADKLTEIIQEQAETLGRTVKVPVGDPKTPEEKLTDLQNYVSDAANSAKNAADSEASAQRAAEAAATSEANAAESERIASGYADTASDAASRAEDSAISARAYNAPDYDNAVTYQAGDVVTYTDGNSYRALQETTGNEPPNIIYWQRVTDYVGDDFFEVDEYGYIVPMDSPSHSRYWRVDQNGYIVPIEGGDGGYRPDTRSLSSEYLNVTNEGYIKHLRADDIAAQEVDADEMTAEVAAFNTLTANAVNAGTVTANSASVTEISAGKVIADDMIAKGPIVDARAFGDVSDDIGKVINKIIAETNDGVYIYIPKGVYYLKTPIVINKSNITISGENHNTIIYVNAQIQNVISIQDNQVRYLIMKNLVIDCQNNADYGFFSDSQWVSSSYFHNITIAQAVECCFYAKMFLTSMGNCVFKQSKTGLNIFGGTSITMTNLYFLECTVQGVILSINYSSMITCAADSNEIGYNIAACTTFDMIACGSEFTKHPLQVGTWSRGKIDGFQMFNCGDASFTSADVLNPINHPINITMQGITNLEMKGTPKVFALADTLFGTECITIIDSSVDPSDITYQMTGANNETVRFLWGPSFAATYPSFYRYSGSISSQSDRESAIKEVLDKFKNNSVRAYMFTIYYETNEKYENCIAIKNSGWEFSILTYSTNGSDDHIRAYTYRGNATPITCVQRTLTLN